MLRIIIGVFIGLHGLVHLLYFGQSARFFELAPGMVWPDGSWAFSRLLGVDVARNLASIFLIVAAIGLIAGGIGVLIGQAWWRPVVIGSAILSSVIFVLFWDGLAQSLDNKGGVGLLINLAILVAIIGLRYSPTK